MGATFRHVAWIQSWQGQQEQNQSGCCWLVALLDLQCTTFRPLCTNWRVAAFDNQLAPICNCQVSTLPVQEQGQLEAGNDSVGEASDSGPEEGLHAPAYVPMNEAGNMFYSVKTRHFVAFLVNAVCGTPRSSALAGRSSALAGGLPGHQISDNTLLRQVP